LLLPARCGLLIHIGAPSLSCAIGEALADDALQGLAHAFDVVATNPKAIIVAEIKFGKIAM
jgi:hypothetical protein